jgi:hypothetical protein
MKSPAPRTSVNETNALGVRWIVLLALYLLGKYFTPSIFLKSASWVQIVALNSLAVARIMLSAMGRSYSKLTHLYHKEGKNC